ncbi:MAG: hypothetical protein ACRECL_10370 [Bradyrhizobium sp.]
MGTIIEFPASRRVGANVEFAPPETAGTVLILPVVRVERESGAATDGSGPEQGAAPGGRRRRR